MPKSKYCNAKPINKQFEGRGWVEVCSQCGKELDPTPPTSTETGQSNRCVNGHGTSLTSTEVEAVLAEHLKDVTYTCSRVWEAWQYGTMTEDDFTPSEQDDEFMQSLTQAITSLVQQAELRGQVKELDFLSSGLYTSGSYRNITQAELADRQKHLQAQLTASREEYGR